MRKNLSWAPKNLHYFFFIQTAELIEISSKKAIPVVLDPVDTIIVASL